ncbi:uncharacterized protein LOC114793711 isoform X2 [Denticeps clupeoides]|uniref:uncharacterized protein LOC114793711 isoform X2 n=1 Tax=Denticeps clupeoides TaxID=299321 RepID=UPI0010A48295|nr:uncharacterized protein LOC114793711 isoform X2 [Denticeps clupeoides]
MDKLWPTRKKGSQLPEQENRSKVPKLRKLEGSSSQPLADIFNNTASENGSIHVYHLSHSQIDGNVTFNSNVQNITDSTKRETSHNPRNPEAENCSAVSTVNKKNFTVRKPPDQLSHVTIKEAQQLEDGRRVTVTGMIAGFRHEGTAYVHGNYLQHHDFDFADDTGAVRLTVWENSKLNLNVGQCCTLTNIAVKTFKLIKFLSTTRDTTSVNIVPIHTNRVFHCGPIIAARVSAKYYCICKSLLENFSADVDKIKCEKCKRSMRSKSIHCVRWTEITVATAEGDVKCDLTDSFLDRLIAMDRRGWCNTDKLERELIDIDHVYVVMEDGNVVTINTKGFGHPECPHKTNL